MIGSDGGGECAVGVMGDDLRGAIGCEIGRGGKEGGRRACHAIPSRNLNEIMLEHAPSCNKRQSKCKGCRIILILPYPIRTLRIE